MERVTAATKANPAALLLRVAADLARVDLGCGLCRFGAGWSLDDPDWLLGLGSS